MEGTMAYKKGRTKFWKKHIKKWQKSGLSQSAYCREKDLHPNLFSKWKRKIGEKVPESTALVQLPVQFHSPQPIELVYKEDYRIVCSGQEQMKQIIASLRELEC